MNLISPLNKEQSIEILLQTIVDMDLKKMSYAESAGALLTFKKFIIDNKLHITEPEKK